MTYYLIEQDFPLAGRWYLGNVFDQQGRRVDTSVFFHATPIGRESPVCMPLVGESCLAEIDLPFRVEIYRPGPALDFTFGIRKLPVVTSAVADLLASVAPDAFERFPAKVEGQHGCYAILNILKRVDCLDLTRSEIDWGPSGDGIDPTTAAVIFRFAVDPRRAGDDHLFRIAGSNTAVIVSEPSKRLLEESAVSGIRFVTL